MARVIIALLLAAIALPAQTVIRLGTLVPKGSRWHEILLNMGEEWKKASGGKIELKIYPGGEQGDEPEMVQKLRIKKLQAVALSGAGLSGIDAAVSALQVPMMLSIPTKNSTTCATKSPRASKKAWRSAASSS